MSELCIQCPRCEGLGRIRVQAQVTSLSSVQGTYEETPCDQCRGTGRGQRASAEDLLRYFSETFSAPEEIFSLARSVASTCQRPRATEYRTDHVEVSYGFRGRKTRIESVTREVETDYWVLASKSEWYKTEGSHCDHGNCIEERDDIETVFCLTTDGSLRKLQRKRQTLVRNATFNYASEIGHWSPWRAQSLTDLDHFMIDFDFDGSITVGTSGVWRMRTEVIETICSLLDSGSKPSVSQIFPKGVGLYQALKNLHS